MAVKDVAVLDFGSGKLTLLVGHGAVNNNFSITASSDIEYAGFMDGEFVEEDTLFESVQQAVSDALGDLKKPISRLYVGVPAEFSKIETGVLSKNFGKQVELNRKKIDSLFVNADKNVMSSTHSVINISPLKYVLDGTNEIYDPIDCYCKTIDAEVCFILADNKFISLVGRILKDLKIDDVEYVSSILASGQYLISPDIRSRGALLVDVGYLTTFVGYLEGDGIREMSSFSMGGAQITAELSDKMKLPFSAMEQVKRQLLVSVKPTAIDYYEMYRGNKIEKVSALKSNEIALNVIDKMLKEIANIINTFDSPNELSKVYLTGGGLSYMKGIEYYMSQAIGLDVEVVYPKPIKYSKPDLSSVIGLLDASIKMEQ